MDIVGRVFHVCLTPVQHNQALSAWTGKVASQVRHRKCLSDLENVCVPLSQMTRHLVPFEKALVLQQQVGAFFSGEFTKHIDGQAATCRYCGESDSRIHRLRWCPRAAAWRAVFPTLMQQWDELPDYTTAFGLISEPDGWREWQAWLDTFSLPEPCRSDSPEIQVFTRMGHVFSRDTRLFASLQVPPSGRIQMVPFRSFGMGSFRGNVKPSFVRN